MTTSAKDQIQEKIGFPAFSEEKQLVGFFQEVESDSSGGAVGDDHEVQIAFLSLAAAQAGGRLNEANVAAARLSLGRELLRQSKSVFQIEECNGILADMKAAALLYFEEKTEPSTIRGRGTSLGRFLSDTGSEIWGPGQLLDVDPNWLFDKDI